MAASEGKTAELPRSISEATRPKGHKCCLRGISAPRAPLLPEVTANDSAPHRLRQQSGAGAGSAVSYASLPALSLRRQFDRLRFAHNRDYPPFRPVPPYPKEADLAFKGSLAIANEPRERTREAGRSFCVLNALRWYSP